MVLEWKMTPSTYHHVKVSLYTCRDQDSNQVLDILK